MSQRIDAWMPLYWGDYLRDTMHLRAEGHGAYLLLIAAYWTGGEPLPDDDDQLAAIARVSPETWQKLRPTIGRFFDIEGGLWRHGRIDRELAKAAEVSESRRLAGKKGGLKSAAKRAEAKAPAEAIVEAQPVAKPVAKLEAALEAAPVAKGQANAKQNPTQPQPQSQPQKKEEQQSLETAREPDVTLPAFLDRRPAAPPLKAQPMMEVGNRALVAAGHDPAKWVGNFACVGQWLNSGADPELDIIPTIEAIAKRDGYVPPRSLDYFTRPIAEARATRTRPLPDVAPRANGRRPGAPPSYGYDPDRDPPWMKDYLEARRAWAEGGQQGPAPQADDYRGRSA